MTRTPPIRQTPHSRERAPRAQVREAWSSCLLTPKPPRYSPITNGSTTTPAATHIGRDTGPLSRLPSNLLSPQRPQPHEIIKQKSKLAHATTVERGRTFALANASKTTVQVVGTMRARY